MIHINSLGEVIRDSRKKVGLTTTDLAKEVDLTQGYISHIENNRKKPSIDIVRKLANTLGINFYELAHLAGHYNDEDLLKINSQKKIFNSMSPQEEKEYIENQIKQQIKALNITQYQEKVHVRLEDFLNNDRRSFYIDDHKLSNNDIKMLIALYGGKEKNYPSDEQIELEYEKIKSKKEDIEKKVDSGEAFFIVDYDHDINTNENIDSEE